MMSTPEDSPDDSPDEIFEGKKSLFPEVRKLDLVNQSEQMIGRISDLHSQQKLDGGFETSQIQSQRLNNFVRNSMLSEKIAANHHPLANSQTMKNSLIDWVATFKKLPFFPANISEFVTSGTLYMILEEIAPNHFKQFPQNILPKDEQQKKLGEKALKKIYKHMLKQMKIWFDDNNADKTDGQIHFDPKTINLNRLI